MAKDEPRAAKGVAPNVWIEAPVGSVFQTTEMGELPYEYIEMSTL